MTENETMTTRLQAFVETHPGGWNHEEWLGLLSDLGTEGIDVSEASEIGAELERTRLAWELRRRSVQGLGPKRAEALAKRFGTLWRIRQASVEEVARVPSMNRPLAEKVLSALS
jgi:hypothetical protein